MWRTLKFFGNARQNSIGIVVGNPGTFNVLCVPATQSADIYIAGMQ